MKKTIALILTLSLILGCFAGCGKESFDPVSADLDFAASTFKHINNGGVTNDDTLPYNIDAITGATLTVEGPGVVTSIPLSIRELENAKTGIIRGIYKDSRGAYTYEGMLQRHILLLIPKTMKDIQDLPRTVMDL